MEQETVREGDHSMLGPTNRHDREHVVFTGRTGPLGGQRRRAHMGGRRGQGRAIANRTNG